MHAVNVDGTENVLGLAHELNIPRTIYVSGLVAFGETGSRQQDESFTRQVPCNTPYDQTKADAHEIALQYQQRGLPLVIICPNAVIGANDHSAFGYFLRLYINKMMPPMAWSPNSIFCCVAVSDLAEGIALAAEKGSLGETYIMGGEPQSFIEILKYWGMKPGAFNVRVWLPVKLAVVMFATLEPFQRMVGLPAFLSRDTVRTVASNFNYSSEKAKRELGWTHRSGEELWLGTIDSELELLSKRKGQSLLQRMKPLEVVE